MGSLGLKYHLFLQAEDKQIHIEISFKTFNIEENAKKEHAKKAKKPEIIEMDKTVRSIKGQFPQSILLQIMTKEY